MPSALRLAAHTPAHARPAHAAESVDDRRSTWKPVLAILGVYAVIIGISEWRLQQHVESVRGDSGVVTQTDLLPAE